MKTSLRVGLFTLSLLGLPGQAHGHGGPVQLAPWYLYYPYEAHFQAPAPVGPFPNWQAPVAAVSVGPALPAHAAGAWQGPAAQPPVHPTGYLQPVGYAYPQQVPSYWYERR